MGKELEYIEIVHPDIYKKIEKALLKTEVEIVMNGFLNHEVNATSDDEIHEKAKKFKKQCFNCINNISAEFLGNHCISVWCGKFNTNFTPQSKCDNFKINPKL